MSLGPNVLGICVTPSRGPRVLPLSLDPKAISRLQPTGLPLLRSHLHPNTPMLSTMRIRSLLVPIFLLGALVGSSLTQVPMEQGGVLSSGNSGTGTRPGGTPPGQAGRQGSGVRPPVTPPGRSGVMKSGAWPMGPGRTGTGSKPLFSLPGHAGVPGTGSRPITLPQGRGGKVAVGADPGERPGVTPPGMSASFGHAAGALGAGSGILGRGSIARLK